MDMNDDRERLRQTLGQLQAQLDNSESLDPAVAAKSRALMSDIQKALESGQLRAPHHRSLSERLQEAMLEFEGAHPTIAGTFGSVVDALARMGI
jgi:hypothetical protein